MLKLLDLARVPLQLGESLVAAKSSLVIDSSQNPGCSFEATGNTDEDVLRKVTEHTQTVHKMNEIPLDILDKVRSASRYEDRARAHKAGRVEKREENHSW
jgi:predicted small metal-binding protein